MAEGERVKEDNVSPKLNPNRKSNPRVQSCS
jgi:hypothetical protein